ncbi:17445_t:CDS:2 [Entrophospora sp. SA101]|nr:860_t:CDS:2 [Entrophospora sp. SA101]CAJ0633649.1 1011_t:CDS:2 [Entrophospora sp. SA101]CAJ0756971.1 17445_t:CDS:2 [Entrophospora sp. SA101]CAJ0824740.1 3401_t:CDS:2 [Entrophospora sp. SA101]CAJ0830603.1 2710_t:CDS:2 [Entrophospora sp. SA101]
MDRAVYETITQVLSDNPNVRMAAELSLRELVKQPEYPISLARMMLSQELDVPKRVTLKNYISTNWATDSAKFVGPELKPEAKAVVRELAFNGLSDASNKIRVVSASIVSKIAHDDWPEAWPNLFDLLISLLKSDNINQVHGALRVMNEFVNHDISEHQFPRVANTLLPELARIIKSEDANNSKLVYSYRTRGRAVSIFRQCIEILYMYKEEHPEPTELYIAQNIAGWLENLLKILTHRIINNNNDNCLEEYGLKLDVIKCLNSLIQYYPKILSQYLISLLEPVWTDLFDQRERYPL